jgi:hypothetical protein
VTLAPVPPTSRYAAVEVASHTTASGETVRHLRRRFIASPDRFQTIEEHTVIEGERPDRLATRFLGDPEQWWRLADANGVMRPEELTDTPGRIVRITLPEGMAGEFGA